MKVGSWETDTLSPKPSPGRFSWQMMGRDLGSRGYLWVTVLTHASTASSAPVLLPKPYEELRSSAPRLPAAVLLMSLANKLSFSMGWSTAGTCGDVVFSGRFSADRLSMADTIVTHFSCVQSWSALPGLTFIHAFHSLSNDWTLTCVPVGITTTFLIILISSSSRVFHFHTRWALSSRSIQ